MITKTTFLVRVIKDYEAPYPDPIQAKAGDKVEIDRSKKTELAGWVWCTNRTGKSGWVPNAYIEIVGDRGRILHDYNAIELSIHVGDILTAHKAESGFYWVTNRSGRQGWVPVGNVETVEKKS